MWRRIGGVEDFYRHILERYPPPEWVPTMAQHLSEASGTTNTKERDMAVSLVEKSTEQLRAEIAELEAQLAAAIPEEPTEPGSVIRFKKWSKMYDYAAMRVPNGLWFLTQDGTRTSRQGVPPKTWSQLLDFIGERNWGSIEVLS